MRSHTTGSSQLSMRIFVHRRKATTLFDPPFHGC
jgi:hypothetical protein